MELLNRYLHAVRFWLPKAQQEDIIAELGEDLRSQIEDRETQLGHPLDDDGIAAVLKQRGNPMVVASRYLPRHSLIGPALFPVYQFILRLVILWILPPVFILVVGPAAILSSRHPSLALIETLWTMLMAAVFAFGVITLIFAALERYPHESTLRWDPRRLPRVPPAKPANRPQPVPGYMAVVEVLAGIGASLVWIEVMYWTRIAQGFDFDGVSITLTPIWRGFFWPILLVALSGVPIGLMGWLRPWWMRARSLARLAVDGVSLILTGALVNMGPWVRVTAANLPATGVADANRWANVGMSIGLGVASIIILVDAVQEVRRLVRQKPAGSSIPIAVRR